MDAAIKAELERITRVAINKLREALEDCKAGRFACASCAATEAKELAELLNDEMYTAAHAVYQWPEPPFQLPPVSPTARISNYPVRPWLTPHQDHTTPIVTP